MTSAGLCLAALGALIVSAASGCNGLNARRRAEPAIDETKRLDRLRQLQPIRFCPIVPGEAAPYPNCAGPPC